MTADWADSQAFQVNFFDASREEPLSSRANPRLTASPTFQAIADFAIPSMAPGLGGFNIDPPAPRPQSRLADSSPPCARHAARSIAQTLEHLTGKPVLDVSPTEDLLSSGVNPRLTAPSRSQVIADLATPPMAPGIGGFNIDPPAQRPSLGVVDTAIEDMRRRCRPESKLFPELQRKLVPQPPVKAERSAVVVSTSDSSLAFSLLGVAAVVTVVLLAFTGEAGKLHRDISSMIPALTKFLTQEVRTGSRLVLESQKGFANEPLPLGILLKDAAEGETVTIAGLAEGTELSLGTSQGPTGWMLSARDLDKTFVGARNGFVGAMDAKVSLHSANGQLLDSQVIRFEWIDRKYNVSTSAPVTTPDRPRASSQTESVLMSLPGKTPPQLPAIHEPAATLLVGPEFRIEVRGGLAAQCSAAARVAWLPSGRSAYPRFLS